MMFDSAETRRTIAILVGILCLFGIVTFLIIAHRSTGLDDAAVILTPPTAATYTDRSGNPVDLAEVRGVPLVVNAWASWSPYSANELPALALLKKEFADEVAIIAVNRMEPHATIEAYLSTIGNTDGIIFINDQTDHFFSTVMGYAMPETLFYNAQGELVEHVRGTLSLEEFRAKITTLIEMGDR